MTLRARTLMLAGCLLAMLACMLPAAALAKRSGSSSSPTANGSGGVSPDDPAYAPAKKAKIVNGLAIAPKGAPAPVVNAIAAANKIVRQPYRYGGGHGPLKEPGDTTSRAGS